MLFLPSGINIAGAPTASSVVISGTVITGVVISGGYSYIDNTGAGGEGASLYQWEVNSGIRGFNDIAGETGLTYTVTSSNLNQGLRLGVIPVALSATETGVETFSAPYIVHLNDPDLVNISGSDLGYQDLGEMSYSIGQIVNTKRLIDEQVEISGIETKYSAYWRLYRTSPVDITTTGVTNFTGLIY